MEETEMPKLTVEGYGEFEVEADSRLVLALTDVVGVDQLHACGGQGRCTTCRVEFVSGEPDSMTAMEKETLTARGVEGARLSCQVLCQQDMSVRIISRLEGSGRQDAGGRPDEELQPQPVEWVEK